MCQAHDGLEAACERAEAASAERDELQLERAGALDHIALLQVRQGVFYSKFLKQCCVVMGRPAECRHTWSSSGI